MLNRVLNNISCCNLNKGNILRKIIVKIGLERIDIQEGVTVEALLDSGAMDLVMSLMFARKQGFKLKKIENPIYMRNLDGTNKEGPIENTVEVNIYYQKHRKKTEIDVIRGQNQNMILGILWLACHNHEINQRMREMKMMRCPEKCRKQWRPKQRKSEQQKQKKEEKKGRKEKPKKEKTIEVKKVAKEQKIWDKEEVAKLEAKARKLVPEQFHE